MHKGATRQTQHLQAFRLKVSRQLHSSYFGCRTVRYIGSPSHKIQARVAKILVDAHGQTVCLNSVRKNIGFQEGVRLASKRD